MYLNKNLLINKKILSLVSFSSSCVICSAAWIKCNLFIAEYFTFSMFLCLVLARSCQSPRLLPKKKCVRQFPNLYSFSTRSSNDVTPVDFFSRSASHPTPFWSILIVTEIHLSETVSNRTEDHFFHLFFFLLLNPLFLGLYLYINIILFAFALCLMLKLSLLKVFVFGRYISLGLLSTGLYYACL